MWIKGKEKKLSPFPLNPPTSTTHMHSFFLPYIFSLFISCLGISKTRKTNKCSIHPANTSSCPHSAFSLQPETNLFGKLRAVQNGTTHSQLLGAGRQTHTHAHSHTSHKMAAFTKISSTPKAPYELNYNLL